VLAPVRAKTRGRVASRRSETRKNGRTERQKQRKAAQRESRSQPTFFGSFRVSVLPCFRVWFGERRGARLAVEQETAPPHAARVPTQTRRRRPMLVSSSPR